MIQKQLGQTGLSVSEIGLGTWQYRGGVEPLIKGMEQGALFIDTAESYGSEQIVGESLRDFRNRVFLATKVSPEHFRRADIVEAADNSLRRLGTDWIDLYQLHWPSHSVPLEETLGAMEELVQAGKIRFIGVSNFDLGELKRAQWAMRKHRIVANQVRYNLIDRSIEPELLSYCRENRISVIAYSPLARGLPYILDNDPRGVLAQAAKATGRTMAQVAINWCLRHDHVFAIPKSNSVEHTLENCGASDWRLEPALVKLLEEQILHRRRSRLETVLRRLLPSSVKNGINQIVRRLPTSLKRRFN
jgi:diketogulonate reductase-like aldo/keto reductase